MDCPNQNSNSGIAICTSVGFQSLDTEDYVESVKTLGPDAAVGIADIVTATQVSQKRVEKSADRTHVWTRDTVAASEDQGDASVSLFASVPPLEPQQQSFYLSDLSDEYSNTVGGLTLHSADTAAQLPRALDKLPRFCLTDPATPHEVLRAISLGSDLMTVPFVTTTSENGVAMTFSFSLGTESTDQPLGIDLWDISHSTDTSALTENCQCYTCKRHHRAYIHHLLSAKEMLAWTLLQIHNFHTVDMFFENVRTSMENGTFEQKASAFTHSYAAEMPMQRGEGPRVRGYQTKSIGGGEPKKNKKAYGRLDEHARKIEEAESGVATPEDGVNAEELEKQGLGQIQ